MAEIPLTDIESASREELIAIVKLLLEENARLRKRNEELERANARTATPFSKGKRKPKSDRKKPGRKGRKNGDKGKFTNRQAPDIKPSDQVEHLQAPVDESAGCCCPHCGNAKLERTTETASTVDVPHVPMRLIKIFEVEVEKCDICGYTKRGTHIELAEGQHGATAHRVGPNAWAMAHILHYHHGLPVRKVPGVLEMLTGISLTQSAMTQQALKLGNQGGPVAAKADEYKNQLVDAHQLHTDDTGWKIGGENAFLMGFGCEDTAYFQIRFHHGAKEVAEVITAAFEGVLNTDRAPTYDAKIFEYLAKQKCLSHVLENLSKLEKKTKGRAKSFAKGLKELLRRMIDLWNQHRDGKLGLEEYLARGRKLNEELERYLRVRMLKDPDNDSMLNELGWQNDQGNLTRFLDDPSIEPTNNFAERLLRAAVIARKVSQCSKNEDGANAYANFKSFLTTCKLRGLSLVESLAELMSPRSRAPA